MREIDLKCVDCGGDLFKGAVFCGACGAPTAAAPPPPEVVTPAPVVAVAVQPDVALPAAAPAIAVPAAAETTPAAPPAATPAAPATAATGARKPALTAAVAGVFVCLLAGGGYWGWSQKHASEQAAAAEAVKARDAAQRRLTEIEVQRRVALAAEAAKIEAEARAQAELQRRLAAAAEAAPAPAQSDEQRVAECADVQACAVFMMAAAQARRPDLIRLAAGRIDGFDKPAQGDRKAARELNRQGLDALGARDFAGASRLFQRAAATDPRDVEIASNLGLALVRAQQPDAATDALLKAVALDPRRSSAWAPMAEALDLLGRADVTEASLLLAWEFSANKDKSLDYFRDRALNADRDTLKASFGKVLRLTQAGA